MSDSHLLSLTLAALLSENIVLVTCVGFGTRPGAFIDPLEGRRTGLCLTLAMVVCTLLSRGADYLLVQWQLSYLRLLVFSLLVPAVVFILKGAMAVMLPELHRRVGAHMGSLTTNAATLACVLLASQRGYDLSQAFVYALFGGLGATAVMISCAGLREEVSFTSCPRAFRGFPILFITMGLMALALVGFYGLHIF